MGTKHMILSKKQNPKKRIKGAFLSRRVWIGRFYMHKQTTFFSKEITCVRPGSVQDSVLFRCRISGLVKRYKVLKVILFSPGRLSSRDFLKKIVYVTENESLLGDYVIDVFPPISPLLFGKILDFLQLQTIVEENKNYRWFICKEYIENSKYINNFYSGRNLLDQTKIY